MKYSNTTIRELTAQYRSILKKCFLFNAAILAGCFIASAPVKAIGVFGDQIGNTYLTTNVVNELSFWRTGSLVADNYAYMSGGAAMVSGSNASLTVQNGVVFDNNSSEQSGGAIHNYATLYVDGALFTNNKSMVNAESGVSHQIGGGAISISSSNHLGKQNSSGSIVYTSYPTKTIISNTTFKNNSTGYNGGAIGTSSAVYKDGTTYAKPSLVIDNSNFIDNKAYNTYINSVEESGNGGAISHYFDSTEISNSNFSGNEASNKGGAIYNSGYKEVGIYGENGKVTYEAPKSIIGGSLTVKNTTFTNNTALFGGAIYNDAQTLRLENVTFSGNTAAHNGGAIYNYDGSLFLSGTNTFTGNKVTGSSQNKGNDIFNEWELYIVDGVTKLDGGINGAGYLEVYTGATLDIGTSQVVQGSIVLDALSTLKMTLLNPNTYGSIKATGTYSNTDDTGIRIYEQFLDLSVGSSGSYTIFESKVGTIPTMPVVAEDKDSLFEGSLSVDNITGTSIIYTATPKSVEKIEADLGVDTQTAQFLNTIANGQTEDASLITLNMQKELADRNIDNVSKATKNMAPTNSATVHGVSTSVHSQILSAIKNHLSASETGRSGGDLNAKNGPWVQGLYDRAEQKSSSKTDGFNGYTQGVAFGFDGKLIHNITVGAGYAYNVTDVKSGDRKTDIDGHNFFVYGEYQPNAWFVNAVINYGMSDYEENRNVLGVQVKGKYDVQTWGGQVMAGYDTCFGITPEAGLRYLNIRQDSYTDSIGQRVDADNVNLLTAVVGAKYGYDFAQKNYTISPEIRLAATYDVVSDDADATVVMGNGSYTTTAEALERFGVEAGVGLTMSLYNALDLSLSYNAGIRKDYTNQMGTVKLKYNF